MVKGWAFCVQGYPHVSLMALCVLRAVQVMPQLLNHLNQDELSQQALDWGTLVVYSCPASCVAPAGVGYVEEFVWAQPPP